MTSAHNVSKVGSGAHGEAETQTHSEHQRNKQMVAQAGMKATDAHILVEILLVRGKASKQAVYVREELKCYTEHAY